jgi:glycosyltransferase involved in cell wall biosynthesis
MTERGLHIAWLGAGPRAKETGGVPGVATDLLHGLATRGHRVQCIFAGEPHELPERLEGLEGLSIAWSGIGWRWSGWYTRTKIGAFVSGLLARGFASLRLRREVASLHREDAFDVVYQFSNIETLSLPASVRRSVPLVIHPETHAQGELRYLISERDLALRAQPAYTLAIAVAVMWLRAVVQRVLVRRASLLVCISAVFRDHLVRDFGFPVANTVVVPNPVRLSRFRDVDLQRGPQRPPVILVLGRVAVRKGVETVVAIAQRLYERGVDAEIRVIGRTSLWSNYTALLEDLPPNAAYLGPMPPDRIPGELYRSDVLLQASRYEPFGLTVSEALAAGVPVVATSEVGASEGVSPEVCAVLAPGDVEGMAGAIEGMLGTLASDPAGVRGRARAEAERLFDETLVCERIERALLDLIGRSGRR